MEQRISETAIRQQHIANHTHSMADARFPKDGVQRSAQCSDRGVVPMSAPTMEPDGPLVLLHFRDVISCKLLKLMEKSSENGKPSSCGKTVDHDDISTNMLYTHYKSISCCFQFINHYNSVLSRVFRPAFAVCGGAPRGAGVDRCALVCDFVLARSPRTPPRAPPIDPRRAEQSSGAERRARESGVKRGAQRCSLATVGARCTSVRSSARRVAHRHPIHWDALLCGCGRSASHRHAQRTHTMDATIGARSAGTQQMGKCSGSSSGSSRGSGSRARRQRRSGRTRRLERELQHPLPPTRTKRHGSCARIFMRACRERIHPIPLRTQHGKGLQSRCESSEGCAQS